MSRKSGRQAVRILVLDISHKVHYPRKELNIIWMSAGPVVEPAFIHPHYEQTLTDKRTLLIQKWLVMAIHSMGHLI